MFTLKKMCNSIFFSLKPPPSKKLENKKCVLNLIFEIMSLGFRSDDKLINTFNNCLDIVVPTTLFNLMFY